MATPQENLDKAKKELKDAENKKTSLQNELAAAKKNPARNAGKLLSLPTQIAAITAKIAALKTSVAVAEKAVSMAKKAAVVVTAGAGAVRERVEQTKDKLVDAAEMLGGISAKFKPFAVLVPYYQTLLIIAKEEGVDVSTKAWFQAFPAVVKTAILAALIAKKKGAVKF